MKHTYTITAINNAVGTPPSNDGVMMIFVKAVAVASTFSLNTLYFLESVDDLDDLGIDADYDVTNSTAVFQQVNEFYQQAGEGAQLWLVGVPMNTAYADYVAGATYKNLIYTTRTANNDPQFRAKIVGLCYAPPAALQSAAPFPADVTATITAAHAAQVAQFNTGTAYSVLLDGYAMSSALAPSALPSEQDNTAFSVSLVITGLQPNGVSSVGAALGRAARISVGHGWGEVADGPLIPQVAYLTNSIAQAAGDEMTVGSIMTVFNGIVTYNGADYNPGDSFTVIIGHTSFTTTADGYVATNVTSTNDLTNQDFDDMGDKQLMFMRRWDDYIGLYWNDAATCTGEDKAFSSQEYNRVVNKLAAATIKYYVGYQGQNLPLQKGTPDVSAAWLTAVDADFYTRFIEPLTVDSGTGDITDGELITMGTNFLGTKRLTFKLNIIPTVIMGGADGTVQFVTTL